jgi:hypothetical protein
MNPDQALVIDPSGEAVDRLAESATAQPVEIVVSRLVTRSQRRLRLAREPLSRPPAAVTA